MSPAKRCSDGILKTFSNGAPPQIAMLTIIPYLYCSVIDNKNQKSARKFRNGLTVFEWRVAQFLFKFKVLTK